MKSRTSRCRAKSPGILRETAGAKQRRSALELKTLDTQRIAEAEQTRVQVLKSSKCSRGTSCHLEAPTPYPLAGGNKLSPASIPTFFSTGFRNNGRVRIYNGL